MATNTFKRKFSTNIGTTATAVGDYSVLLDIQTTAIGLSLAKSIAITRPEAVVLFGGLAQAGDLLFIPTKKYMEENLLHNYQDKIPLLASALPQSDAAVLGASALIWKTQL